MAYPAAGHAPRDRPVPNNTIRCLLLHHPILDSATRRRRRGSGVTPKVSASPDTVGACFPPTWRAKNVVAPPLAARNAVGTSSTPDPPHG